MEIFSRPNFSHGVTCPVCGASTDKPVALVPISGTEDAGRKIQSAIQVHLDCIDLTYMKSLAPGKPDLLFQLFDFKGVQG